MRFHRILMLSALLASIASGAQAKGISAQQFVSKASMSDMFEIKSSQLALEKSQREDVREFAQQMIDNHEETTDKLTELLDDQDSNLKPVESLDAKHQKLMEELESISEANFDARYIAIQRNAHKEAVTLFSNYAKNGSHKALKNFTRETLPGLKQHLSHAKQL